MVSCDLCGQMVAQMTVLQGSHMCVGFWRISAELPASGAEAALLLDGGLRSLMTTQAQLLHQFLLSMGLQLPRPDRTMLIHTTVTTMNYVLRVFISSSVRLLVLGHSHSWHCLHIKPTPVSMNLPIGDAERTLQQALPVHVGLWTRVTMFSVTHHTLRFTLTLASP